MINVNSRLGGGLKELARKFAGQGFALLGSNDALVRKIALVADQDHGNVVEVLHSQNLFSEVGMSLKVDWAMME